MDHNSQGWQLARFDPDRCTIQLETVVRGVDLPDQGYAIGVLYAGPEGPIPENHLAAAAPDLLEACKAAENWLGEFIDQSLHDDPLAEGEVRLLQDLRTVIAKAEGK
jgi:hypothetical protein